MESHYSHTIEADQEYNIENLPQMMPDAQNNFMNFIQSQNQHLMLNNLHQGVNMQMGVEHPFSQSFYEQCSPPPFIINLNSLSSMLNENRKALLTTIKASNEGAIDEAVEMLQKIEKHIVFFANVADLQPNSRFILRQERELISQNNLAYF